MKIEYEGGGGGAGTGWSGTVANYASLPSAAAHPNEVYLVQTSTGFLWNKRKGLYQSNGSTWNRLSNAVFQVQDNESTFVDDGDNTKKMVFQLDKISSEQTRTIEMADRDIYLDNIIPINGFDLQDTNSLPDLAFADGSRTLSVTVKGGQPSFHFWCNGVKFTKTTTQNIVIPNVTGNYYCYFDNTGTLQYVLVASLTYLHFYQYSLVFGVYWNATQGVGIMPGNECHGINMPGSVHEYLHKTFGARYESGLGITGLSLGAKTYMQTGAGYFWNEDILHTILTQSTHSFLYRLGASGEWTRTTASNEVGYKAGGGTYYSWNQYTGGAWQLTEGAAGTLYWNTFFMVSPNINGNNVIKIIGQNAYANAANARSAIDSELNNLITTGLPIPEDVFLYVVIIDRNGNLQAIDAAGNLYYDLRRIKGGSATGGGISDHNLLSNLQGGTSSQYYHLTQNEYSKIRGYIITDAPDSTYDGVDTAGIGIPFNVGDYVMTSDNKNIWFCHSNTTGQALWILYRNAGVRSKAITFFDDVDDASSPNQLDGNIWQVSVGGTFPGWGTISGHPGSTRISLPQLDDGAGDNYPISGSFLTKYYDWTMANNDYIQATICVRLPYLNTAHNMIAVLLGMSNIYGFTTTADGNWTPNHGIWFEYFNDVNSYAASWASSTAYARGNCVTDGGIKYKCLEAHTSSANAPSTAIAWATSTSYSIGDVVIGDNGDIYQCHTGHTSSSTDEPRGGANYRTYWYLAWINVDDKHITTASPNWICNVGNSSSITSVNSGIAVVAGEWVTLEYRFKSNRVDFFINNIFAASITTNIPTNRTFSAEVQMHRIFDGNADGTAESQWLTATSYSVGDRVWAQSGDSPGVYICKYAHTSATGNKPGSGLSYPYWYYYWNDIDFHLDVYEVIGVQLNGRRNS